LIVCPVFLGIVGLLVFCAIRSSPAISAAVATPASLGSQLG